MTFRRLILVLVICFAAIGGAVWWATTLAKPRRLIFVPAGDVGLGFKSFDGRLEWIEYASWGGANGDTALWSVPWWVVEVFLVVSALLMIRTRRWRPARAAQP